MRRFDSKPENGGNPAPGNNLLFGYFVFPPGWEALTLEELKQCLGDGKNMKITNAPQNQGYFNQPEELIQINYFRFLKSIKHQLDGVGTVEWIFLVDPSSYETHSTITESLFTVTMVRLKHETDDEKHNFWRLPAIILKAMLK